MNVSAILAAEHPNTTRFRHLAIDLTHEKAQLAHLLTCSRADRQAHYERRAMLRLRLREIEYLVLALLVHQAQEAVNYQ